MKQVQNSLPIDKPAGLGQAALALMEQRLTPATIADTSPPKAFRWTPNRRISLFALVVVVLDQLSKQIVWRFLPYGQEKIILEGFFKFVHWGNTGAAWSLFRNNNGLLAAVALVALLILFLSRHHFDSRTLLSQVAFGMICGGIVGNLIDRLWAKHVIDFIYFYVVTRGGTELGFPAFNLADSAICTGVGLVFLITWRSEHPAKPAAASSPSK
jgi:signal peptidase II